MGSPFIENSKHPEMTAAVDQHIMGSGGSNRSVLGMPRGGDIADAGNALPREAITPPFGHPNTGVNYGNPAWAGTTPQMTDEYFKP